MAASHPLCCPSLAMPIMMVHPSWQHEPSMSTCARDLTRLGALRGARGRDQRVLETGTGVPRAEGGLESSAASEFVVVEFYSASASTSTCGFSPSPNATGV